MGETNPRERRRRRGRTGRQWWTRRWLEALEGLGLGDRLARGRALSRSGAVSELTLDPGDVRAAVAGPRGEVNRVGITLDPIGAPDWERLQTHFAGRAVFAARLLSGEMPEAIEETFTECGLALFPGRTGDVGWSCSCGETEAPCVHAAAVFQAMAERFNQDPFQILLFRGRGREDLLLELRQRWAQEAGPGDETTAPPSNAAEHAGPPGAAPSIEAPAGAEAGAPQDAWRDEARAAFWKRTASLDDVRPRIEPPLIPESVLLRLGPPPSAVAGTPAAEALPHAYRLISAWALKLAEREAPSDEGA